MGARTKKKRLLIAVSVSFIVVALGWFLFVLPWISEIPKNELISDKAKIYVLPGSQTAKYVSDATHSHYFTSVVPVSMSYDLGSIPIAQRKKVIVSWFTPTEDYDTRYKMLKNAPENYVIETNDSQSATLPKDGWKEDINVSGNVYHSRQHVVILNGKRWIRLTVTKAVAAKTPIAINVDIHDIGHGITDDWIFYGDSITAYSMVTFPENNLPTFNTYVKDKIGNTPITEDGGVSGQGSMQLRNNIDSWLSIFPGKYVGIAFGSNDGCINSKVYYEHVTYAIKAVEKAGKVVVMPQIPFSTAGVRQTCAYYIYLANEKIYKDFPGVIRGPNLWTFLKYHPEYLSNDKLHPSPEGYAQIRNLWAEVMVSQVYLDRKNYWLNVKDFVHLYKRSNILKLVLHKLFPQVKVE